MEKSIEKAIDAEQEYLRLKSENSLDGRSIYDFLIPCGYENLAEYRKDRIIFLYRALNSEVVEVSSKEIEEDAGTIFIERYKEQKPYILYNINLNQDTAFVPLSCEKKYEGFLTIKPGYDCEPDRGNILTFDGDLDIVMLLPESLKDIFKYLVQKITSCIGNYTDKNIVIDGNDILIDNKKVLGVVSASNGNYIAGMLHISFADKDDVVKSLCPESVKIPGHIDFISAERLLEDIILWLQ